MAKEYPDKSNRPKPHEHRFTQVARTYEKELSRRSVRDPKTGDVTTVIKTRTVVVRKCSCGQEQSDG